MKNLLHYWHLLTYIGSEPDMSYIELKRVQMVNLVVLLCVPFMLFFSIVNYGEHRFVLSGLNFFNAFFLILVLILQYYRKHAMARVILLVSSFFVFYFGGLIYRNGGEYFLLCILILSMLLYDSNVLQVCVGTVVIVAILSIYAYPAIVFHEETVPRDRVLYNIASALAFIVVAVSFFKNIIYNNTQMIEEQRLKLQALNSEKEMVFSIVAHDMRSPMATLENMVDLLRQQMLSGDISEAFIIRLQQHIVQQNTVLENLLEWSSSSMHGIKKNLSEVRINEVIEDIVLFFEPRYRSKKLLFDIAIDPGHTAYADRRHLTIIFRNLISNAIKFSHTGGKIIVDTSEDEACIYIHVKDHGVGMSPDKSRLLFNTVQQRSVGTEEEPGAGLGLMLCNELIRLNVGTIHVDSIPYKGSVFTIGLPKKKKSNTENKYGHKHIYG